MKRKKTYLTLFLSTMTLSAFTFGGGYVIVSLLKKKFVDELGWISEQEMLDMTAIAQSCPGAVAVNAAILVGYRIARIPGALVAICGTVLPPFVIISAISACYTAVRDNAVVAAVLKGMQSGIAAVIADVTVTLTQGAWREGRLASIIVLAVAFCASWFFSVNVIWIILACGSYGLLRTLLIRRHKGGAQ